ncbi:MAG: HD-GYP domain-containing protein [Aestuariibacter sp.]
MSEQTIAIISIEELVPGMYVNRVVKQKGSLKMKSKGLVKRQDIIESLKSKGIVEVEVDYSKSHLEEINVQDKAEEAAHPEPEIKPKKQQSVGEALVAGQELHDRAKQAHEAFLQRIREGQSVDVSPIKEISEEIIESVFNEADGLSCVALMKDTPDYILEHSVNCAIYMTIFAKHMEFDKALCTDLCLAGFLMDCGMATVPADILAKPGKLNKDEMALIYPHVDFGLDILEKAGDVNDVVLGVVRDHHERLDGSGYPEGKAGENINAYGRMAAIVDCYDAMTNDRPYRRGMTPTNALKQLLADSSGRFDQSLVQQFIRSIGVHPVGSLVKLKSGKLGIIVKANKADPLKPLVMSFYSIRTGHHTEIKRVDLAKVDDEIEVSVRPDDFKISLTKFFREVFLPSLQ